MKLVVDGVEEPFPADWRLHVVSEGTRTRVTVEREGAFMTLAHALALRDLLTTSSRPALRRPGMPPQSK